MRGKNKPEPQIVCTDHVCRPMSPGTRCRREAKREASKASAQVRREQIAKMYAVPISWVMLEDELTNWRASMAIAKGDGGFVATVKANVARTLRNLVSHFRYSVIPGR
jgi:hypothetical protein